MYECGVPGAYVHREESEGSHTVAGEIVDLYTASIFIFNIAYFYGVARPQSLATQCITDVEENGVSHHSKQN